MKQFAKQFTVTLQAVLKTLTKKERSIFIALAVIMLVGCIGTLGVVYTRTTVAVPAFGGTLTEGIVGTPRFINPLLALSQSDLDLSSLVYSGLIRKQPNGSFIPDLAKSVDISDDGRTYTFILKDNVTFHDGTPVTAKDVVFTVQKAQNPSLKSPIRVKWEGVEVTALDEKTVQFVLPQRYAAFLENATLGILPEHVWSNVTIEQFSFSDYNVHPIGSGPYRIASINEDKLGVPSKYILRAFKHFALGKPHIKTMVFKFYPNQDELLNAYAHGHVDNASSITPDEDTQHVFKRNSTRVVTSPLPRVFGVFINKTKNPLLNDSDILSALDKAINKDRIIQNVLGGYGEKLNGPIPPRVSVLDQQPWTEDMASQAAALLDKKGWKLNEDTGIREKTENGKTTELTLSLSTNNTPDLQTVAELIREDWANIGVALDVKYYETGILDQDVIRPREFDLLLFGQVIEHQSDLYAFWHSSQRNDPGLNITLYANQTVDRNLVQILTELDFKKRSTMVEAVNKQITKDRPAFFLYSPDFIYLSHKKLRGVSLGSVVRPSDRFTQVYDWYLMADRVWPFFLKNK